MNKKYIVKVDDNFHYMDESERYDGGSYSSLEEAIKRCEEITTESLKGFYKKGTSADELKAKWLMFGEDPFVIGADKVPFSAREYLSEDLCSKIIKETETADEK